MATTFVFNGKLPGSPLPGGPYTVSFLYPIETENGSAIRMIFREKNAVDSRSEMTFTAEETQRLFDLVHHVKSNYI